MVFKDWGLLEREFGERDWELTPHFKEKRGKETFKEGKEAVAVIYKENKVSVMFLKPDEESISE